MAIAAKLKPTAMMAVTANKAVHMVRLLVGAKRAGSLAGATRKVGFGSWVSWALGKNLVIDWRIEIVKFRAKWPISVDRARLR
jgi:hypothetical protein